MNVQCAAASRSCGGLVGASGVLFKASIMVVIVGILPLMCAYAAAAAHAVVLPRVALPVGLSFRVYTIYTYIPVYMYIGYNINADTRLHR